MKSKLRAEMGAAAVRAAASVDYIGAGTVEFLLDENGEFYFLEMNTRLQVEHPVTELVTGLDLVALQMKVAAGDALGIVQEDIAINGHAIEVRLYAEDPADNFLPSTGVVDLWRAPSGPGVRVDDGIATGLEISPYYDAMVAKIVASGETREVARQRLIAALVQTALFGPASNRDFLIAALEKPAFAEGAATTAFIAEAFAAGMSGLTSVDPGHYAAAAVLQFESRRRAAGSRAIGVPEQLLNWTNAAPLPVPFDYSTDDVPASVTVTPCGPGNYEVSVNGHAQAVHVERLKPPQARLAIGEQTHDVIFLAGDKGSVHLAMGGRSLQLSDRAVLIHDGEQAGGGGRIVSAMHGKLLDVLVSTGDTVQRDDTLAIVEAMKMQLEIKSDVTGTVSSITAAPGEQIAAGDLLLEIATE